jgi:hypothetical protein
MRPFAHRRFVTVTTVIIPLLHSVVIAATIDPTLEPHWLAYLDAVAQAKARVEAAPIVRSALDLVDADAFVDAIGDYAMRFALTADPANPIFVQDPTRATAGIGLANPDNVYYEAVISDAYEYRIQGTRGTNADLSFQIFAGVPGPGILQDSLLLQDLIVAPNGSYSITVSPERPASGNWLRLGPGADNILVRQTFNDWSSERRGTLRIDQIGGSSIPRAEELDPLIFGPSLGPDDFASTAADMPLNMRRIGRIQPRRARLPLLTTEQAAAAIDFITGQIVEQADFYYPYATNVFPALGTNVLIAPRPTADGLTGQFSSVGVFDVDAEQAIIVTLEPSDAPYQGFELNDAWLIPFDYSRPMSLTTSQAETDPDGRIRYVISISDPQVPNWVDPAGRTHGIIFLRWQGLTQALGSDESPRTQVVPLEQLRQFLPASTPTVDASDRAQRLRDRARELAARFANADPAQYLLQLRLRQLQQMLGLRSTPFHL